MQPKTCFHNEPVDGAEGYRRAGDAQRVDGSVGRRQMRELTRSAAEAAGRVLTVPQEADDAVAQRRQHRAQQIQRVQYPIAQPADEQCTRTYRHSSSGYKKPKSL